MEIGDLTAVEHDLLEHVAAGTVLTCSTLDPDELRYSNVALHQVRAEVIREILAGGLGEWRDPRGVRIAGARITGALDLDHVEAHVGLSLSGCWVDEMITAYDALLPWINLSGSTIPAMHADGVRITRNLFIRDGFTIDCDDPTGAIRLLGGEIGGVLDGRGAVITNASGPAVHGDRMQVNGNAFLNLGFSATAGGTLGAVRLLGARIGGDLDCGGATLAGGGGPGLNADGLDVGGSIFLNLGFSSTGSGELGAVRLLGVKVEGDVDANGARLTNPDGPALMADGLTVGDNVFLRHGFTASAATGEFAAVRIIGAQIAGGLECGGATLVNTGAPALDAERASVGGNVLLGDGFNARSSGHQGTLRLNSMRIGGNLEMFDGRARNDEGPAIDLRSTTAIGVLVPDSTMCDGGGEDPSTWSSGGLVELDGFTYTTISPLGATPGRWLNWIRHRTLSYAAQPYQQLAALHRGAGHDSEARRVLIAQQQDALRRGAITGYWPRLRHRLSGAILGYGHRTWRALAMLAFVVALGSSLGVIAGHIEVSPGRYVTVHTEASGSPGTPCSIVEQIGVGLDRGLPVINVAVRERCDLDTSTTAGQVITAVGWLLQGASWVLATLVVAGYTGLVRRSA
ncbi:MAG: hypothetical protein GEV11_19300 [Streptosporangiales bacterium]|nr:hypothetical protein [Streptosporangiales bacterium]